MNIIAYAVKSPSRILRRLYDWTIRWAGSKKSSYALFVVAFMESSFFPIPPDVLLIPMVVGNRARWFMNALICTLGSVGGAILGYLIGWALFESVGKAVVDFYNLNHAMDVVTAKYNENAFPAILAAAFTPIPYKVFTIAAGVCSINIGILLFASAIGRGGRFFLVAGLLRIFGDRISKSIEKYFDIFALAFFVLLVAGFLAVKHLR